MFTNAITATLRRIYQNPADGEGGDLGGSTGALDIESRIAMSLGDDGEGDDGVEPDGDGGQEGDDLPDNGDGEANQNQPGEDDDETLASVLGIDDDKVSYDDEGNVVFNAVIDGEAKQVKMADLVKSFQLEGHVTNKSMKLEADRREFEQVRDHAYGELAKRIEHVNGLISMSEESLLSEFNSIDWNTLRVTDPAEWSALRQSFAERANAVAQVKAQVGQAQQGMTEEQQREAQAKQAAFHQQEINKMIIDNPAWADQATMAKDVGEIGRFMKERYGFAPEEIADHMDARLMRLIRDAQAFNNGKQGLQTKQVPKNTPKFRKPGSENVNRNNLQKARDAKANKERIRKSGGSVDAIAQSLIDRM